LRNAEDYAWILPERENLLKEKGDRVPAGKSLQGRVAGKKNAAVRAKNK